MTSMITSTIPTCLMVDERSISISKFSIGIYNSSWNKNMRRRSTFSRKYVPPTLSRRDAARQRAALKLARKEYTRKHYVSRPRLKSFRSRGSKHVENARRMYGVDRVVPSRELARKTGCSVNALRQIVKKGEGAYYSSGSRPNQTAHSWAYARLGSAITGNNDHRLPIERKGEA